MQLDHGASGMSLSIAQQMYQLLFDYYGPQQWWPGDAPFEIAVGAILTQNTAWHNVERAIANLRDHDALSPTAIATMEPDILAELIRSSGYFRQKSKRLRVLAEFINDELSGDLAHLFAQGVSSAREQLLTLHGIGPETADSIVLYAGSLPTFVIDTYTARVVKRHAWLDADAGYYELQDWFTSQIAPDPVQYNEFHALLVQVGKQHCKPRPICDGCPLESLLPPSGCYESNES